MIAAKRLRRFVRSIALATQRPYSPTGRVRESNRLGSAPPQHLQEENLAMSSTDALVFDAIRTPRGKGKSNGSLHATKPIDLVVGLMHETLSRHADLDPKRVDDVVLGVVSPIGDQGGDIAKAAAIKAGLPDTVAGVQLNRFCASGLEAVNIAAQKVASGWEDLV